MSQTKEAIAHTDTVVTNGTPEASKTMLPTQKMIVDGTKPVSYTHLDVYKRQVLPRPYGKPDLRHGRRIIPH